MSKPKRFLRHRRDSPCEHRSALRRFYRIETEPSEDHEYDDYDDNCADYSQSGPSLPESKCHTVLWELVYVDSGSVNHNIVT